MTWLSNLLIPDEVIFELRSKSVRSLRDEDVINFMIVEHLIRHKDENYIITREMCIKAKQKFMTGAKK